MAFTVEQLEKMLNEAKLKEAEKETEKASGGAASSGTGDVASKVASIEERVKRQKSEAGSDSGSMASSWWGSWTAWSWASWQSDDWKGGDWWSADAGMSPGEAAAVPGSGAARGRAWDAASSSKSGTVVLPGSGGTTEAKPIEVTKKIANYQVTWEKPQKGHPVQCKDCGGWLRAFKFSMNLAVVTGFQETSKDDPELEKRTWHHQCAQCLSWEKDVSFGEAISQILGQTTKRERSRCRNYTEGRTIIQEQFPWLCTSSKSRRNLARGSFLKLFSPWAALIRAKNAQLDTQSALVQEIEDLRCSVVNMLNNEYDDELMKDTLRRIDELEVKLAENGRMLAFREHDEETQKQFLVVAEFEDEWLNWGGMRLRSWYKCTCGLVYSSKSWQRLHDDVQATGQRYYCRGWECNGRRYKQTFGQLAEFVVDGNTYYSYAPMPPKDIEDIRARSLELSRKPKTPKNLWDSIVQYMPQPGASGQSIIRPAVLSDFWAGAPGAEEMLKYTCKVTEEGNRLLSALPEFNWHQIHNMVEEEESKK